MDSGFEWALPFDGNIFVPELTMMELGSLSSSSPKHLATVVPMKRMVLKPNGELKTTTERGEPQIAVRRPFKLRFSTHPCFSYGNGNKVELLRRAKEYCNGSYPYLDRSVQRLPPHTGMVDRLVANNYRIRALLRQFGIQRLIREAEERAVREMASARRERE
eukprot:NODE_1160_length_1257_cov_65.154801_g943_i0.p1 GENE.NODE_1160_length_1257_cov_65.154801_g943_i0~~NODE_1160_length_1257_cov_65.154801_g943_i0.p1  ORF type:complete len:162 (+),score=32.22 NODE_1160_length_1257_cov_65.154801_g943_i0:610-1095(+)